MTVEHIVSYYKKGFFLMDNGDGLDWYSSRVHALIPLDERFHCPRSLKRHIGQFEVRINGAFEQAVEGCAHAHRQDTWINPELKDIYMLLRRAGVAHSFETWHKGQLAGAVLGLVLGKAFIGESMFYHVPEASKVAMVRLVQHLKSQQFQLFDAQIQNPHLERFGAYEVKLPTYNRLLARAVLSSSEDFTHISL